MLHHEGAHTAIPTGARGLQQAVATSARDACSMPNRTLQRLLRSIGSTVRAPQQPKGRVFLLRRNARARTSVTIDPIEGAAIALMILSESMSLNLRAVASVRLELTVGRNDK